MKTLERIRSRPLFGLLRSSRKQNRERKDVPQFVTRGVRFPIVIRSNEADSPKVTTGASLSEDLKSARYERQQKMSAQSICDAERQQSSPTTHTSIKNQPGSARLYGGKGHLKSGSTDSETASNKHVNSIEPTHTSHQLRVTDHDQRHTRTTTKPKLTLDQKVLSSKKRKTKNSNLNRVPGSERVISGRASGDAIVSYDLDRFSVTIDITSGREQGVLTAAEDFTQRPLIGVQWKRQPRIGRAYQYTYEVQSETGERLGEIELAPAKSKANYMRVEFNPSLIGDSGCMLMLNVLRLLLGERYSDDIANGNVTRLDLAANIANAHVSELLLYSPRPRKSALWAKYHQYDGKEVFETETQCVGSTLSDYAAKLYDKSNQMWQVKGIKLDQQLSRLEVKLKPYKEDRKSIRVKELLHIHNPFKAVHLARYPMVKDDPNFEFFIYACQRIGTDEALSRITNKHTRAIYRQKLAEHQPDWWNPDAIWDTFLKRLAAFGLLLTGMQLKRNEEA